MAVDIDFDSIKKRANKEFESFNEKLKEYNISKKKLAFGAALLGISGIGLWKLSDYTYENSTVPEVHKVILSPIYGINKTSSMLIDAWEGFFEVKRVIMDSDE